MDDPGLDDGAHRRALAGLARINRLSLTARQLAAGIDRVAGAGPRRVLDLACGDGAVTVALARLGRRRGRDWRVDGADVSAFALELAAARAEAAGVACDFHCFDSVADPLPDGYDVVVSSLFLHHLDGPDVVALLEKVRRAGARLVVSDLRRSRLAVAVTWVTVRLLARSPVVHVDGVRSVRAAWTAGEMREMAQRAGLAGARVRHVFPLRWRLTWSGEAANG